MQLAHIAIWTNELERSRDFYIKYFNGKSNEKYVNPKKGFASYFVTFEGGKEKVDAMIEQFRSDGYKIVGEPRITGDGYYEGAVLDPDGNIVEMIAWRKRTGIDITRRR